MGSTQACALQILNQADDLPLKRPARTCHAFQLWTSQAPFGACGAAQQLQQCWSGASKVKFCRRMWRRTQQRAAAGKSGAGSKRASDAKWPAGEQVESPSPTSMLSVPCRMTTTTLAGLHGMQMHNRGVLRHGTLHEAGGQDKSVFPFLENRERPPLVAPDTTPVSLGF